MTKLLLSLRSSLYNQGVFDCTKGSVLNLNNEFHGLLCGNILALSHYFLLSNVTALYVLLLSIHHVTMLIGLIGHTIIVDIPQYIIDTIFVVMPP